MRCITRYDPSTIHLAVLPTVHYPLTTTHFVKSGGGLASAGSRSRNKKKTQKRIVARPDTSQPAPPKRWMLLLSLLLVVATLALYFPVNHHPFLNYDDDEYVTDNVHVKAGLTGDTVAWAFTHLRCGQLASLDLALSRPGLPAFPTRSGRAP